MSYITRPMVENAIGKMRRFHAALQELYEYHGIDFLDDIGRRNMLMSRPQEKFFAAELQKIYAEAYSDGKTGQPDILIPELDKELECKITSPHRGGGWGLQSDHQSIVQKGKLDYLYMLCNWDFDEFAVFHFENLTVSDFRKPSPGSRGKVSLILRNAIDKCNILAGSIKNRNEVNLEKLHKKKNSIKINESYLLKKVDKSINYWENSPNSFSIGLESFNRFTPEQDQFRV